MKDLSGAQIAACLGQGLRLRQGPFSVKLSGSPSVLAIPLQRYYPNYPVLDDTAFADAHVDIRRSVSFDRDWFRTGVARIDDGRFFTKFPLNALLANIEWTSNWFVAMRAHQFLMFHAAGVANSHGAVLFPGVPGAGKSTLCAYLIHHGWRLLSDEFTLIRDESLAVHPFPRLIPLKNESIDVIRDLIPTVQLGPRISGTRKGTIAHVCPADWHLRAMEESVVPKLAIYPTFRRGAVQALEPMMPSECFTLLTQNSFNYVVRGATGFALTSKLANHLRAFRLTYSDLSGAAATIAALLADASVGSCVQ